MIRAFATLFRIRLSLLNGVAALSGLLLFPRTPDLSAGAAAAAGVALLAAGGSALNQVLERDIDAAMKRTMGRPIPAGLLSAATAIGAGTLTIVSGLILLVSASVNSLPPLLGIAALVGYLLVYTPLKRRTPLALPLGALCGAVPPLIGWTIAGGTPGDYRISILCGLFFLWQMPHFWLLQRRYATDYRMAGIPLADTGRGLLDLWVVALSVSMLMLPLFGLVSPSAAVTFSLFPVLLIGLALTRAERPLFTCLNLFPLLLTITFLQG